MLFAQNPFIDDEASEEEEELDEEDYDSYTGELNVLHQPSSTQIASAGEPELPYQTTTNPSASQAEEARETFERWLEEVRDRCSQAQATTPREAQTVMLLHHAGMEDRLSSSVQSEPKCLHRPVVIPWLRGWVYFESRLRRASVDGPISDDLERRPLLESVDPVDWWTRPREDCRAMGLGRGDWLRVRSGQYRGDIGLVLEALAWGYKVLVVPHAANCTSHKWKRHGHHPEPALWAISATPNTPSVIQDHHYDQGLYVLEVAHVHALRLVEPLTWNNAKMFLESGHPLVWECDVFPPVQEWVFETGLVVLMHDGKSCGMVEGVGVKGLEVAAEDGSGTRTILWRDVWKDVQVGDYVETVGEPSLGGWVDQVSSQNLTFLHRNGGLDSQRDCESSGMKLFYSHCNCVVVTQPPHSRADNATDPTRQTRVVVPWLGVEVRIGKPHHRFRAYKGTVRDVRHVPVRNTRPGVPSWRPTPRLTSGLSILVELNRYSGANPRSAEWFAYEDIWELHTGELLLIFQPLSRYQNSFRLSECFMHEEVQHPPVEHSMGEEDMQPCPVTPPQPPSQSPLWASYWWEHLQLRNKEMRVTLPETKKDVVVKAMTLGDQVALVRIVYKQPVVVDVMRMKIRHPHQRDYDLWMVTKGEYVGRYVRGLDYEVRSPGMELWWNVVVVNMVAGQVDENTGMELTLPATHLVLVPETSAGRHLNDTLKRMLRKQFEEWSRK
ncbi:hypothetical protein EV421DRAFT_1739475 [Armillaria borealis]|uniref:KOW domain-containing protein n=1 Tax=Armillaria borealis TaxID=47425 RepID=A0AA39MIV4_9AGAR|nr:hypothetical protein EV421DRAFT_1739475 [Armillaria borealis]